MLFWQKECELLNGQNVIPLNISRLSNGIYLIKIQTDTNKLILKVKN